DTMANNSNAGAGSGRSRLGIFAVVVFALAVAGSHFGCGAIGRPSQAELDVRSQFPAQASRVLGEDHPALEQPAIEKAGALTLTLPPSAEGELAFEASGFSPRVRELGAR